MLGQLHASSQLSWDPSGTGGIGCGVRAVKLCGPCARQLSLQSHYDMIDLPQGLWFPGRHDDMSFASSADIWQVWHGTDMLIHAAQPWLIATST